MVDKNNILDSELNKLYKWKKKNVPYHFMYFGAKIATVGLMNLTGRVNLSHHVGHFYNKNKNPLCFLLGSVKVSGTPRKPK